MILPSWALFGLAASICAALMPLVQEKFKVPPIALVFAIKLVTFLVSLPLMLAAGLPASPLFYTLLGVAALLYTASDIIYFRTVAVEGAGIVARLIPASVIATFFLWFLVDPALIDAYLQKPWISLGILATILFAVVCAMRLKQCEVSRRTARSMWFVLFAATVGPILSKSILTAAGPQTGPMAYLCLQALLCVLILTVYSVLRRPLPLSTVAAVSVWQAGHAAGLISALMVGLKNYGYSHVDHPAYMSVLYFTDAVWILLIYRATGRRAPGDIWAGLGIVASAAALVILKSV